MSNDYEELISLLDLKKIQPLVFQCERLGDINIGNGKLETSFSYGYRKDDPVFFDKTSMACAPKFEFFLSNSNDKKIFHQLSIYEFSLSISDFDKFQSLWQDEKLQNLFMKKQIQKTVWPIFRQNVIDGLTRMSLPAISLPWII